MKPPLGLQLAAVILFSVGIILIIPALYICFLVISILLNAPTSFQHMKMNPSHKSTFDQIMGYIYLAMFPLSCYWYLRLPKRLIQNVKSANIKLLAVTLINIFLLCIASTPVLVKHGLQGISSGIKFDIVVLVFATILLLLPSSRKFYATSQHEIEAAENEEQ